MVGTELKRLSRRELVDIIYQMKKNEQQMQERIAALELELKERRMRLENVGSIAEATAAMTDIFTAAQTTADLYLHEIEAMKAETEQECAKMLQQATQRAEDILVESKKQCAVLGARFQIEYEKWLLDSEEKSGEDVDHGKENE